MVTCSFVLKKYKKCSLARKQTTNSCTGSYKHKEFKVLFQTKSVIPIIAGLSLLIFVPFFLCITVEDLVNELSTLSVEK